MTERIHDYLRRRRENGLDDGPCLVVDLNVVRDNYRAFARALPDSRVFYAVKANPAPELLSLLVSLGSCFDTASVAEIERRSQPELPPTAFPTATPSRREGDIARAFALGVRLFAVDCKPEAEKVARAGLGSFAVFFPTASARIGLYRASSGASRRWLSRCSSTR